MTSGNTIAQGRRIRALVIGGAALLTAGASSTVTLWYSNLARYMYVEDLGLDATTMFAITRATPVDRGIIIFGGILILLGAAALILAAIRARHRRRANFVKA